MSDGAIDMAPVRKPRADAERNRLRLLEVARAAFTDRGADVPLEEIAREAGVGIGTLYRHFPSRDALLVEVYRHGMEELGRLARQLSETHPPVEALRAWMRLFVDYIATKQVLAPALNAIVCGADDPRASTLGTIQTAMATLTDRAVEAGELRLDMDPLDLLRALVGVTGSDNGPQWRDSAFRLIDVLIAGLRVR